MTQKRRLEQVLFSNLCAMWPAGGKIRPISILPGTWNSCKLYSVAILKRTESNLQPGGQSAPLSTGLLRLDLALAGGLPRGALTVIAGPAESGKSSLCLHILASAQKSGQPVALIDADRMLDPTYAVRCGIAPQQMYVCQPAHAVQALDMLETLAASGAFAALALDSLEALTPPAELALPLGAGPLPGDDRRLSLALRRLANCLERSGTVLIVTMQAATRPGAIYHELAGHIDRLALKLHTALRMELHPTETEAGQEQSGASRHIGVRLLRRKFSPCIHPAGFDIMFEQGIIKVGEVFDLGLRLCLVTQAPSGVYLYQGAHLGDNRGQALVRLEQQPELCRALEQAIRQQLLPNLYPAAQSNLSEVIRGPE
jgi:recombination protein RecA